MHITEIIPKVIAYLYQLFDSYYNVIISYYNGNKEQQLELDMEKQTGSIRERRASRLYIVTLLI